MGVDQTSVFFGCAFDESEMDVCDASIFYDSVLESTTCALNEKPAGDARCLSIKSYKSTGIGGGYSRDLFEEYDVLPAILGTGNFGCVRECVHRATGERHAVKTIEKYYVARLDHVQREIELLRAVNHPGIVKMVDCYEDADHVHIVTERYTGGELFDKIVDNATDRGCLPEHQAAKIIKSLLEAVDYLHSKDIVHRDIKPENVLFESDEEGAAVKLIDFGVSRRHRLIDAEMSKEVGTSYYMSPGVLRGKYNRSCDIWSVGVIAYVLLCGYPPFNGSDDYEVEDSILENNLFFDERLWLTLSKTSRDFVSRLLRIDSSGIDTANDALRHPWIAEA